VFSSPALAASSVSISSGGLSAVGGKLSNPSVAGYDVSYPECGTTLPTAQRFAVVGVNGGIANNQNPCLSTELTWAETSTGYAGQPALAVYVNTGNPGDVTPAVTDWPTSGSSPLYGDCNGTNSTACAYMYGQERAAQDVVWAKSVGLRTTGLRWWLDVETTNSWSNNQAANAADLEAMVAVFRSAGGQVGVYSANDQWDQIVGNYNGPGSYFSEGTLNGLPDWVAGATTLTGAKQNCANFTPFTAGGYAAMAQYVPDGATVDNDYSCQR
jgi:hypothetical protein